MLTALCVTRYDHAACTQPGLCKLTATVRGLTDHAGLPTFRALSTVLPGHRRAHVPYGARTPPVEYQYRYGSSQLIAAKKSRCSLRVIPYHVRYLRPP